MNSKLETKNFRTQTNYIYRKNPNVDNYWGIALDVGYSSVKAYSPNSIVSFPAFAKKVATTEGVMRSADSDIFYKDETGIYAVGEQAYAQINPKDSSNDTNSMFVRDRFSSKVFQIIARVGIALSARANQYGNPEGREVFVQTGLPPAYLDEGDDAELIDALAGTHEFAIKCGNQPWKMFKFTLPEDHISVMPQPKGTLLSIATDANGKTIPRAKDYFAGRLLIFDPGFGTLDTFNINKNVIDSHNTYNNLGMHRVFEELVKEISNEYGVQLHIHELQEDLKTGTFRFFQKKMKKSTFVDFSELLAKCNERVCKEALATIDETYDYLAYHDYLVLTGGTSNAWDPIIREYYKDMETLTIINGTVTDNLPSIFTNVRGYYMKLLHDLQMKAKKA